MILKFSKNISLLVLAVMTITLSASNPATIFAQELSKTPNFGKESTLNTVDPYTMPSDYPQEILDWYRDNMDARSYIAIDQETNRVLAQQEGNKPYPIASMSKIISTYLVYQAIDEGKLSMDQMISIDPAIIDNYTSNPNLSNVGLVADQEYSVEDLLNGVLLSSGNDATSALMWQIYGSEEAGVNAMSDLLHSWGINNFKLVSVSGTPNIELAENIRIPGTGENDENTMSAADIALVAQHLITDFPQVLDITNSDSYQFKAGTDYEQTLVNNNLLRAGQEYGRDGITGLKSGFTDGAGRCFVATSTENGRKVIAVTMGTFTDQSNSYWETEILLDELLKFPDLYKNEALPTNLPQADPKEDEASESDSSESNSDKKEKTYENKRNNPLTNFLGNLF
ncbi:serine hydrolase [Eremococcus coleocola]|uniref:serine hydrolase n=1 Tax=Eremococcus coleocola TaxID=88132 RepID=UPI00058CE44C